MLSRSLPRLTLWGMALVFVLVVVLDKQLQRDIDVLGYAESEFSFVHKYVDGSWQVFLKSQYSDQLLQLSFAQNTSNPAIHTGKIAWEGFVHGTWQVFLFDGIRVVQLTSGDISVNPNVEGDYVTFGRKGSDSAWYAELYNSYTGESKRVAEGIGAKRPLLEEGRIVLYGTGKKEYTDLIANELLPSDSALIESTESVSEQDIKRELGII